MIVISGAQLQDFVTLFLGLVVEAFPFVVLGVIISVLIALFFKEEWLVRFLPQNTILSHMMLSVMGILLPVCECGNVPVVRRLLLKGFKSSHAITFLLAAPILNPITLFSTLEAFSYDKSIALIRIVAAFIIANLVGLFFSLVKKDEELLTEKFHHEVCEHDHSDHSKSKFGLGLELFQREFLNVMSMLVVGAFIAAISQSFIPREIIMAIGGNLFGSIIAMMVLAFVISICANVDAFFALSYASNFTVGSIMSFLVFGPMIDIKMLAMLRATFKTKTLVMISALVALLSIITGLIVNIIK